MGSPWDQFQRYQAPPPGPPVPERTGEDYLKAETPEVQSIAKAYLAGDAMPTGNPRLQGAMTRGKIVAMKYAQDMGIPFSDALYAEKRKMMTDLAASGPSSMGGILSNGKSAFGHLANLSDKFVDLGNYSGPDVPGGAHAATVGNYIGNVALPTSDTRGKILAVSNNAVKYGQEATKFYSGTGGGVEERLQALKTAQANTSSGKEQAAFLQTEKELMLERIHQKEAQVRSVLGQGYLDRNPIMTDDVKATLKKLETNITRLKGDAASGPSAAAAPVKVSSPDEARKLPSGTKIILPDGRTGTVP